MYLYTNWACGDSKVLEALALNEEPGPQQEDATLPDSAFISAAEQQIQAFRDATFIIAAIMPKAGAKRKAPELDPGVRLWWPHVQVYAQYFSMCRHQFALIL